MAREIRGFALLTTERRRRIVVSGHVGDDYLRSVAGLLDHHPELAVNARLSSEYLGEHLRFSGAYHDVGQELILHGHKMTDTITNERASIGQRALHVYQIARTINHPPGPIRWFLIWKLSTAITRADAADAGQERRRALRRRRTSVVSR